MNFKYRLILIKRIASKVITVGKHAAQIIYGMRMEKNKFMRNSHYYYKNFNMGLEIDIAGTFIYDGINNLKIMQNFDIESEVFSFLYHISVGIERMQKVIIVLLEEIDGEEEFEKSLISHNHCDLHDRIRSKKSINFHEKQNEFLQLITRFYKGGRYNNYAISSELKRDVIAINNYFKKYVTYKSDPSYFDNRDKEKELLGRVIGSITSTYYNLIESICSEKNIYTYELRNKSKAQKVFLPEYKKNSLNEININETIAFKELVIFLLNTGQSDGFLEFMKQVSPLNIDIAFLKQYLSEVIKGEISQQLIDEVEHLYYEEENIKERLELLSLIGNEYVFFDEIDDDSE
ncbi:hypothetical protein ACFLFF_18055 [Brevibacillus reuszeri]|uniref:hypothetical protein n=1 Tax=Brevibacillus reuszeri TaxID=54915 RepID=UPI00366DBFFC